MMKRLAVFLTAGLLLFALWSWSWAPNPAPNLTVTFLDVGQGDSAVVRSPGGVTLIVDTGRSFEDGDSGRQVVLPYLRRQGINRIDALVLTHPDDDHIGGSVTLLERIRTLQVLLPAGELRNPAFAAIESAAARRRVVVREVAAGEWLDFGDGCIAEVLNPLTPEPPPGEKDNDRSVVLRLRHGTTSLLLTGDLEEAGESALVRYVPDLSADILKLGHHGSRTSTSERFLERVRPAAAIISVGRDNAFGHPSPRILDRLRSHGIPAMRTDEAGAVTVESDGNTLKIRTTR